MLAFIKVYFSFPVLNAQGDVNLSLSLSLFYLGMLSIFLQEERLLEKPKQQDLSVNTL